MANEKETKVVGSLTVEEVGASLTTKHFNHVTSFYRDFDDSMVVEYISFEPEGIMSFKCVIRHWAGYIFKREDEVSDAASSPESG